MVRTFMGVCAIIGGALIAVNLVGILTTVRFAEIADPRSPLHERVSMTPGEFLAESQRHTEESVETYVMRMTHAMHRTVVNYSLEKNPDAFRVPLFENYLLFFAALLWPEQYRSVDFCDTRTALERGIGLCSQQSMTLARVLNVKGLITSYIDLQGHTMVSVLVDEEKDVWWMLDPDYDVIVPLSLREIEKRPERIRPYYRERGITAKKIETLISLYASTHDNRSSPLSGVFFTSMCARQNRTYQWIWIIPVLLIFPWVVATALPYHRRANA